MEDLNKTFKALVNLKMFSYQFSITMVTNHRKTPKKNILNHRYTKTQNNGVPEVRKASNMLAMFEFSYLAEVLLSFRHNSNKGSRSTCCKGRKMLFYIRSFCVMKCNEDELNVASELWGRMLTRKHKFLFRKLVVVLSLESS